MDDCRLGGHIANIGVHGKLVNLNVDKSWSRSVTISMAPMMAYTTPTRLQLYTTGKLDLSVMIMHIRLGNLVWTAVLVTQDFSPSFCPSRNPRWNAGFWISTIVAAGCNKTRGSDRRDDASMLRPVRDWPVRDSPESLLLALSTTCPHEQCSTSSQSRLRKPTYIISADLLSDTPFVSLSPPLSPPMMDKYSDCGSARASYGKILQSRSLSTDRQAFTNPSWDITFPHIPPTAEQAKITRDRELLFNRLFDLLKLPLPLRHCNELAFRNLVRRNISDNWAVTRTTRAIKYKSREREAVRFARHSRRDFCWTVWNCRRLQPKIYEGLVDYIRTVIMVEGGG
ncbi:hypothetical protein DOTSEDRAFT_39276 [Dothistroma septosporum NZE10]|uniref:Uncharacterized protein n=1 Tax=Dothistroma septosporum (strain NZE10 / CBS 128990) TaxID=675120 RepID=N1PBF6_DOTSN|nr:hypothetical protein DOTSEDRAFT_39276 [Dothistroma septosporum NZE10]